MTMKNRTKKESGYSKNGGKWEMIIFMILW